MENGAEMKSWANGINVITLFVEDLEATRRFYLVVFRLSTVFEDESCAVFNFRNMLVNLLKLSAVDELISPATAASPDSGSRFVLTIEVADVDAVCEDLSKCGSELLNGPIDRPWGIRTASFKDPGGHIWEISMPLKAE